MRARSPIVFVLAVLFFFTVPAPSSSFSRPLPPKLVLTSVVNGLEPEESFTCDGFIHGYITLPEVMVGSHLLESVWTMPNGAVNQHSKIPIDFSPPGRQTAYVWFQFREEPEGLLGGSRESDNPTDAPYNGDWTVEVRWDQTTLVKSHFKVKC